MTSPLVNFPPNALQTQKSEPSPERAPAFPEDGNPLGPVNDKTARRLKPRHIQLIGIGGYCDNQFCFVHGSMTLNEPF